MQHPLESQKVLCCFFSHELPFKLKPKERKVQHNITMPTFVVAYSRYPLHRDISFVHSDSLFLSLLCHFVWSICCDHLLGERPVIIVFATDTDEWIMCLHKSPWPHPHALIVFIIVNAVLVNPWTPRSPSVFMFRLTQSWQRRLKIPWIMIHYKLAD